jgi:hypothetical protein
MKSIRVAGRQITTKGGFHERNLLQTVPGDFTRHHTACLQADFQPANDARTRRLLTPQLTV